MLSILAKQNKMLAELADNGDEVLRPLARDRESIARFIRSRATAAATAERSADFEENLRLFPAFLEELGPTMDELGAFSDELAPVADDLALRPGAEHVRDREPAFAEVDDLARVAGRRRRHRRRRSRSRCR